MSQTAIIRRGRTTFGVIFVGGRPVRVFRAPLPAKHAVTTPAAQFTRAEPDTTGPTAVDCENELRGSPLRFPAVFIPSACVGAR